MTVNIREATKQDIAQWSQMRTQLWPDTDDNHLSEINEFFAGESIDIVTVFIAEVVGREGNQVVGFIELNIRNFAEGSRKPAVPYVEGWYIKPTHQAKGYGKKLMQAAESWALSQGYDELASDTELGNTHSIDVHKRLGFVETERVVCFLKTLRK